MLRSAMSNKLKIQSLSNEVLRRLRNTNWKTTAEEKARILYHLQLKLYRSGYPEKNRHQILVAGVRGYLDLVRSERLGRRRVSRQRTPASYEARRKWKLKVISAWFSSLE